MEPGKEMTISCIYIYVICFVDGAASTDRDSFPIGFNEATRFLSAQQRPNPGALARVTEHLCIIKIHMPYFG